jgi:hypothetical protein
MTRSPRSIYRDHDLTRDARPRLFTGTSPPALRLVPPLAPAPAPRAPQTALASVEVDDAHDAEILAVLDAPPGCGESADALYRRKERELGALFATLPAPDAIALAKRLSAAAPGDILSARFSRLVAERRQRLIDFLGDAKRREAVEIARHPRRVKGSAS